ncbi:MAG: Mur ligase family protein [Proteobacteria bacterium]|nr:Mur ligase family protein [Pseudomonadota bacterium]
MHKLSLPPSSHIHLIGICGTGMGALAGLLNARGHRVTGSDEGVYPPMSDMLQSLQIPVAIGYGPQNLDPRPDLVIVGNICRADHPEAQAAKDMGIPYASFPRTVRDLFLRERQSLVIAGTHGKTTTTALTAFLLEAAGSDPSVLIGGVTRDFGSGFKLGKGPAFVIEGDEYDSAWFEKVPKFSFYVPHAAVITSVEHDHIDIYPTAEAYEAAFRTLVEQVDPGPLAVYSGDAGAMRVAEHADCPVVTYAVKGDPFSFEPSWLAIPKGLHDFELRIEGRQAGLFRSPMMGRHNLRNTLAALIVAHVSQGVPLETLRAQLPQFQGVQRRQQQLGTPGDITVYDDFAHHPTAVRETLASLKARHPNGKLIAAFEPRSATACRSLHQQAYAEAFDDASLTIIAPCGRNLPDAERLDTQRLARDLRTRGTTATATATTDDVLAAIVDAARPGDTVVLFSNGAFGDIRSRLIDALTPKPANA